MYNRVNQKYLFERLGLGSVILRTQEPIINPGLKVVDTTPSVGYLLNFSNKDKQTADQKHVLPCVCFVFSLFFSMIFS